MVDKEKGFEERLLEVVSTIQYVLEHNQYGWVKKYGVSFLTVASDQLQRVIKEIETD